MKYFNFNLWQDGQKVAGSSSRDREAALRDGMHYALMYEQDGPVVLKEGNRIVYRSATATKPSEWNFTDEPGAHWVKGEKL